MKSEIVATELKTLEESRKTLEAELDSKIQQVGNDLASPVAAWMRQRAKRQLDANADKIDSIGAEGVAKLKKGIDAIVPTLPEVCRVALGASKTWPHRNLDRRAQRGEDSFWDAVFRKSVEPLGPVLEDGGILYEPRADFRSWDRVSDSSRQFHRYNGRNPFNEITLASHREYEQLLERYASVVKAIESKTAELGRAKTQELWEAS